MVTEVRLLLLVSEGLLLLKGVAKWRATTGEVLPNLRPGEIVSSTNFHEHGFGMPVSDFLWGFLQAHGIQL
jgi:hypothetical protein